MEAVKEDSQIKSIEEHNEPTQESDHDKFQPDHVEQREGLFSDISADNSFTEMESLCMNCHEQGVTRLLLTRVPFFREIIIMAFNCPHCGFRSNEIQSGGSIAEKAMKIELKVNDKRDLNRQIVKSETAILRIPELDFEIPASTQRGLLNTIEGFLMQSIEALKEGQEERRKIDPETTARLDEFIGRLEKCINGETLPFTIIVDDLAGNSFIENPNAPQTDPNMTVSYYTRTAEQNWSIGLTSEETAEQQALKSADDAKKSTAVPTESPVTATEEAPVVIPKSENNNKNESYKYNLDFDKFNYKQQIMSFRGNCPECHAPADTRMFALDIPYFKEVIIMSTNCDYCGYKSSDCKAGGPISAKGKRIVLKVTKPEDLNRDILKSETAVVTIPEKELKITRGTLGGRFTTVEGLIVGIKDDLLKANPFLRGDSGVEDRREKFAKFLSDLEQLASGETPFTVVMDDPVANSYVQSLCAPEPDPAITEEEYERSWRENEDLGLNDIKTENYEEGNTNNNDESL